MTKKFREIQTDNFPYISDRDPETVARQEALAKRDKMTKDDDERMAEFVAKQVARQRENMTDEQLEQEQSKYTELIRISGEEKISLGLKLEKREIKDPLVLKPLKLQSKNEKKKRSSSSEKEAKRPKTAIEELIEEDRREKEYKAMKKREKEEFPWLKRNIIVKITTKSLGEKFYKQKGQVLEVHNRFKATLCLCSDSTKVTVDQKDVETVIPSIGRKVLILQGKFRGALAILKELNVEKFCAELEICDEDLIGSLPYEHFSKYVD